MTVANAADKPGDTTADGPIELDGDCDLGGQDRLPINAREKITVVTCREQVEENTGSFAPDMTAWLVRGPTATRGRSRVLGMWKSGSESGQSFSVDTILRDRDGNATHVLIRHGTGGLDEIPDIEILDYLPARDAFGPKHGGVDVVIAIGANGASARLVVCNLAPGGTYYQDKECRDQQGAKIESFAIGP